MGEAAGSGDAARFETCRACAGLEGEARGERAGGGRLEGEAPLQLAGLQPLIPESEGERAVRWVSHQALDDAALPDEQSDRCLHDLAHQSLDGDHARDQLHRGLVEAGPPFGAPE